MAMSLKEEFFEVADTASQACVGIRDPSIKEPLAAIKRVCEEAKRAWSGSNIGYHATVYYQDIRPKPAGVEFNPEWGLMDRYGMSTPDPGWRVMDHQTVINELAGRAGSPDLNTIEEKLSVFREKVWDLKEHSIALFSVALHETNDAFLDRKLKQIDTISIAGRAEITNSFVPKQVWSRDSGAIAQGTHAAPHQSLASLYILGTDVENALDAIGKLAREAALHLERIERQKKGMKVTGKKIFIGHGQSKIWLELQNFLRDRLHLVTDEFNSVPPAGISNKERLEEALDDAAFAFLVMTAEDAQPDGTVRARQNVVHEAGLFQGRLGFRKAIILLEQPCEEFSNIHGLGQIRFPKSNVAAAYEEVRRVLEREGLVPVA
jgi:predicted nucleotide-binding protein